MIPVFTLKLNHKILPRLVTVGKYDGEHPCLTAATNGNKVFIHSPHGSSSLSSSTLSSSRISSSVESDVSLLNVGQHVTSVCAGNMDPGSNKDVLMIGSQTHILAYDVERNADLFYKEVNDGANSIMIGNHLHGDENFGPLAYVGGNCSVLGFDKDGEDRFWTVTGDNVHSLTLCDYNFDGREELLVGSEDYDIRVFQGDELVSEVSEGDTVTSLCSLGGSRFGFALANGIVGVYSGESRLWRTKSKHFAMCISSFDFNNDGVPELITGWSSGKVDIKHPETGEILYKTSFGSHVAGIVKADYRLDGKEELICCSVDGEVRGFLPLGPSPLHERQEISTDMLQELNKRKTNLLLELKNFEVSQQVGRSQNPQLEISRLGSNVGAIPAITQIRTELKAVTGGDNENAQPHISLIIETTNKIPIKTAAIFSDGLFDGESYVVHPPGDRPTHIVEVPLYPGKDIPYNINITTFVGKPGSTQFHVFDTSQSISRFSLYVPCPLSIEPRPHGRVVFSVNERLERIKSWINKNFLYEINPEMATQSTYFEVSYMSLRTSSPVFIKIEPENGNRVTISTDDLDLAGDIVQAMAEDFGIEDLSSTAEFPRHMEDLETILVKVQELHKVRESLSADMADHASMIRNLVVRAEDARLMEEMKSMKMAYTQLYDLNKDIMRGYEIRRSNHVELLECLKIINQAIQKGARLRVGKPKTVCTNTCRRAVKEVDHTLLVKAISSGH